MEVFLQELNAFPLRALLDQAAEEISDDGLEKVLSKYGVTRREISDSSVWVSVAFVEAVLLDIAQILDDPAFLERASIRGISPRYMGPLYPLMAGFGSPMLVYRSIPRSSPRMDKLGVYRVEQARPGFVRLVLTPNPAADQRPFICTFRRLQLARGPVLFSRPPAHVVHETCIFRGAPECVFDITWEEAPPSWHARVGGLLGLCAGTAFAVAFETPPWSVAMLAAALGTGGWALGKAWEQRQELQARVNDIDDHNRALERMTQRNEQRFAELLEAKADVDRKVEERTAELSVAMRQLSETLERVRELDQTKTNFFSNVSHDLRTPLTLILGPLADLRAGREPPSGTQRAFDVMYANATRLHDLINQLLDLAKIDAGKMQLARVPTDVGEIARTIETRFSGAAAERKIRLTTQIGELQPMVLDPGWIENALTNLVGNALRFTRSAITIVVEQSPESLSLSVIDDGVGIAAEDLPKVFDRFAQGSDDSARKGGTGLGLAIVREAARLHGGDASVESIPGVQTRFRLVFPRTSDDGKAARSLRPAAPAPQPTEAVPSAPPLVRPAPRFEWEGPSPYAPLLVLADDDDDLREFIGGTLATQYRVTAVRNGREALAAIAKLRPDAVVSDVVMPELDGYGLCRMLRAEPATRDLPVVLLTARKDVTRVLEGFEAGASDYVAKPFHARELLARVDSHVRLRRLISEMAHRERLASLGVLAASLAHQVRNPLNALMAGLPAMQRKLNAADDRRHDDMFAVMLDSCERINVLVGDLLDLSRVDHEPTARFKPASTIESCARLIQARVFEHVELELELDHDIELVGRPGDIGHVFLNLIDNAARAAEPRGKVHVRLHRDGEQAVIEVGDSGKGIPPERMEEVFTPFFTTRPAGEGTGLGLTISRQVVLQHGGRIDIGRSSLGGALLSVTLPLGMRPSELPADQDSVGTGGGVAGFANK